MDRCSIILSRCEIGKAVLLLKRLDESIIGEEGKRLEIVLEAKREKRQIGWEMSWKPKNETRRETQKGDWKYWRVLQIRSLMLRCPDAIWVLVIVEVGIEEEMMGMKRIANSFIHSFTR